jgi:Cap4 SAVED domain
MLETVSEIDLERFVAGLRRDYSKLSARVRELTHSVDCDCKGVALRLHFPTINQGKAAIWELVNAILDYMTPFALHRSQVEELEREYGRIPADEYRKKCERQQREAISLFIRAQKATNKNGEAGELLLFLLTEWILKAPQLLAKLPLKTNRDMPVHGTDGIHVGYLPGKNTLCTYWGESKLYGDVNKAIATAVESIEKALRAESTEYELALVARNISGAGLTPEQKSLLLSFLDPIEGENYNSRVNVTTCLVGFDFDAYKQLDANSDEQQFASLALTKLQELAPRLSASLKAAGIQSHLVEMFFFPVPSVQDLRDQFQAKIGWKNDSGSG